MKTVLLIVAVAKWTVSFIERGREPLTAVAAGALAAATAAKPAATAAKPAATLGAAAAAEAAATTRSAAPAAA
jgi:hypothetical protein